MLWLVGVIAPIIVAGWTYYLGFMQGQKEMREKVRKGIKPFMTDLHNKLMGEIRERVKVGHGFVCYVVEEDSDLVQGIPQSAFMVDEVQDDIDREIKEATIFANTALDKQLKQPHALYARLKGIKND